jgi:hypothetical protein
MEGCDSNVFFFQFSHVAPKVVIKQKIKRWFNQNMSTRKIHKKKI